MRFPNSRTLIVKTATETVNEIGEAVETYTQSATVKGEVWPLTANSTRGAMGVVDTSTHRAMIEKPVAVIMNQQIVDGAQTYLVQYAQNWGTHTEAVLRQV